MLTITDDRDGSVSLSGRLDASQVSAVEAFFKDRSGPQVLNLINLQYISSAGLSVLIQLHVRLQKAGETLTLRKPSPLVANILRMSRLDLVLRIES